MFVSQPTFDSILRGGVLATLAIVWVVTLVRVNGLRSFSKMTSFDFVMTVAMGSLVASSSQSTNWNAFLQSSVAMAALFVVQFSAAFARKSSDKLKSIMQNEPVILMRDGVIFDDALAKTRVSRDDLIAKLREANVCNFSSVHAVILETTGDISVLHGGNFSDDLLQGARFIK
ncbi:MULTISPECIES: DUF421 domain-containing protein [unclassified Marinobacter]|uniref:DUF421 domain-containing protein n=1 Tax=unclassified Marinobacter TaxID=83889 RepID=UPI0026E2040C|nr:MULTISPECIES: YetF domain-containing protein [unclassified Marinobacter]MDO6441155.1 DUF421 domain-containing protein [Marinobacter sp. 2_MG-2023]MDO6825419.1 DUF421 domain-containing protein [Marinobacter sp. 1_MG-2023]